MSVLEENYLVPRQGFRDPVDKTKTDNFNSTVLPSSTHRTYTIPTIDTTLVGTNTSDILTNKNIQGSTNIVDANNIKSATTVVNLSSATAPTAGQVITATSNVAAVWSNPSNIYFNKAGVVTQPLIPNVKQWYGYGTTATGSFTFDITTTGAGGAAIFSDLANAFYYTSCQKDTTSSTAIPFSSIRSINTVTNTVIVNVQTGNSGAILVGGTYTGMQANATSCRVYLYIVGS